MQKILMEFQQEKLVISKISVDEAQHWQGLDLSLERE
jgi:hypothetical protein